MSIKAEQLVGLLAVVIATIFIAFGGWAFLANDENGRVESGTKINATAPPQQHIATPPVSNKQPGGDSGSSSIHHPTVRRPVVADPQPVTEFESSTRFMNADDEEFARQENLVCKNCVNDALAVQSILSDLCNESSSLRDIMKTEPFFALVTAYRQLGWDMDVLNEEIAGNVNCEDRSKWIAGLTRGISIRQATK